MDTERLEMFLWAAILTVIVFCATFACILKSLFEAAAFNRVTGQHVSTWDAMWVELRIQSGPSTND